MPDEEYPSSDHGTILIEEEQLQESWTSIPNTILRRSDVSPGGKLTYVMLLSYAHQKGSCFPGQQALAQDLGAGERSVRRYLQELESLGLLKVQRRGLGKTNIYVLTKWVSSRPAKLADQERPKSTVLKRPNWPPEKEKQEEIQDHHQDVADELRVFGIEPDVADQLARSHEPAYIRDRLERVRYLLETNPTAIRKTPQAFLVAAIKHPGIDPAPGYKTPAERQAEVEAKAKAQADAEAAIAAEQERQQHDRAAEQERVAQVMEDVRRRYPTTIPGTTLTTTRVWETVLSRLRTVLEPTDYTVWVSQAVLIQCDRSTGILAAQNHFCAQRLQKRFDQVIRDELAAVLGFSVRLKYVALSDLIGDASAAQPNSPTEGSADQSSARRPGTAVDRGETLFDLSRSPTESTGVRTGFRDTSTSTSANTS